MLSRLSVSLVLFTSIIVAVPVAAEDTAPNGHKGTKEAEAIFAKIKTLAGDWEMAEGETKGQTAVSVRVIAGGSAVVERQFPNTPMEMITVYHLNGDEVMLTHYCMLGNQPRLKASRGKDGNTLIFSFAGATNMASDKDPHMHDGKMTFVNDDTIKSTWTQYIDGKAADTHTFELKRRN